MSVAMGISFNDGIDKAKRVLRELVDADERILKEPASLIAFS